jgi:nucleoside phosphorylase
MPPDVLVIAATPFELAWAGTGVRTLACGIGPVEAAAATARALALGPAPAAVVQVGIAGARLASGIVPGAVVLGSVARYADLAAEIPLEKVVAADPAILELARAALPLAPVVEIATSAAVGGSASCPVEAMEGFGVLRACALAGVPAIELRAIANVVEERDRSAWDIPGALAALAVAGTALLERLRTGLPDRLP